MRKWTTTAGLLFLAASAVYSDPVSRADEVAPATPRDGVKPAAAAPATQPKHDAAAVTDAFAPVDEAAPIAVDAPAAVAATDGQSLSNSQVNVTDVGTVEIHVNDANINEVLRMLSLQLEKNILPSKEVRGAVTANLYDVTVKEALDAILKANGFDYREKGNVIYVYSAKEIEEQEKKNRTTRTQVFRLFYTPAANAANMIKPVLSADAQVSFTTPAKTGIDSGSGDVGGDSHATEDVLVVTDYPEKLENVARIIKEVDRRPQQILVEAVIMRATLQDDNALGVDFTAVGGVDFASLSGAGSGSQSGSGLQQALNGQIIENPNAGAINDAGVAAGSVGGGGLKLGLVKNNVGLFIQALEGVTDTVVMANPKVLVLNKQKGEVHVGSEQGYRTTVTSEVLAAEDVKFLETGTRLVFRPYIGDNGNIRMEVKPEDSSGSVNAQGLPNKFVTQVTTNVMVQDGHTIVIGGLFRESSTSNRSQVPGLGSLPGVGPLFGRRSDSTVREEVIILLTPHIVKDESAYSAASEAELKQAERLRVGMRKGMMPWGRERLAESSYEKAVEEMNKPNPDTGKAVWYLDCATNLNPKFSEAIALKARITGREVAATDNSTIRHFVSNQILRERLNPPVTTPPATAPSMLPSDEPEDAAGNDAAGTSAEAPATQPAATVTAAPAVPAAPTTAPAVVSEEATAVDEMAEFLKSIDAGADDNAGEVVADDTAAPAETGEVAVEVPTEGENATVTDVTELPAE